MNGKILKLQDRKSHVCEFGIFRNGKMGVCNNTPVALIDDQYFCADCIPDVLMRIPEILLFNESGSLVEMKRFIELCK